MESLRNEPVMLTGNGPMGGGYGGSSYSDGGGLLSTILAASLIGGGGFNRGGNYCYQPSVVDIGTLFNEKSASDTRRDVKDSESEIKDSLSHQTASTAAEFRALDNKLYSIDKEALSSRYESQIASKDSTVALYNKIDAENNQLRNQIGCFSNSVEKQFGDLKIDFYKSLVAIRERELLEQNNDLVRALGIQREENQANDIVGRVGRMLAASSTQVSPSYHSHPSVLQPIIQPVVQLPAVSTCTPVTVTPIPVTPCPTVVTCGTTTQFH